MSAGQLNGEEIDLTGSGYATHVARSQCGIKLPFDPSGHSNVGPPDVDI